MPRALIGSDLSLLVVLCVSLELQWSPCLADDAPLSKAYELQLACQQYRERHFRSGFVRLRIDTAVDEGVEGVAQNGTSAGNATYLSIWYNGDSLRNDGFIDGQQFQHAVTHDFYTTAVAASPVIVAPLDEYVDAKRHFGLVHPRWIGLGYNPLTVLDDGGRFRCLRLLNEDWPTSIDVNVVEESLNGVDTWKITCNRDEEVTLPTMAKVYAAIGRASDPGEVGSEASPSPRVIRIVERDTYWIAPSQGHALIRNERETAYPDRDFYRHRLLSSEYELDTDSAIWYPKVTTTIVRDGNHLIKGNVVTVEEVSFTPPNDDMFTLEGFSLAKDRHIYDRTMGSVEHKFFWDGSRAVRVPSAAGAVDLVVPAKSQLRRWLLWGNAVVLALFAGYLLLYRRGHAKG